MSAVCSEVLIHTADLRIEYFQHSSGRQRRLACVFVPFQCPDLEGNPYGGELLLNHGYDVISFKTTASLWYQNVPERLFEQIAQDPRFAGYEERIGYGSSMGAYAAIAFSRRLSLQRVFAFSPQFSIREDFDRRWADYARQTDWPYVIDRDAFAQDCVFHLVYDNRDVDRLHVQRIQALSGRARVQETRLPYTSHPVSYFLYEVDLLKDYTLGLVRGPALPREAWRRKRRESATYLRTLAEHASDRSHDATALKLVTMGLQLRSEDPGLLKLRARLLERTGQTELAVQTLQQLVRIQPDDFQDWASLGRLQLISGKLEGLQAVDRALELKRALKRPV